jgi:transcription initiation factor TFIIF subunit beta
MEVEESENKPFDVELAQEGEETQPDPDEHMITDTATGRVWIVKVSEYPRPLPSSLSTPSLGDPP